VEIQGKSISASKSGMGEKPTKKVGNFSTGRHYWHVGNQSGTSYFRYKDCIIRHVDDFEFN
jgi:hypothetical protein